MSRHYILNEENVAVPVDLLTWAQWFEYTDKRRVVRRDEWPDGVVVSTVFLGLDHTWPEAGPRTIFETMVFHGTHAHERDRYATWVQAEAGHIAMLRRIGRLSLDWDEV